jgi:hypothetical protein
MTGTGWVTAGLAGLMLVIAVAGAARLVVWRLRGRPADPEADVLHVLMGVAMAGMFEPRISPVPAAAWRAVFVVAAAWFGWRAIRSRGRRRAAGRRCAHPAHAVECAAMVYMLLPSRPVSGAQGMAMAGMSGPALGANPAVTLVLALFMLGYVLWTTDQLATLSRARTGPAAAVAAGDAPGTGAVGSGGSAATQLAPRVAACCKIAMGAAMGYMLLTML